MKYLVKASKKSGAIWIILINLILSTSTLWVNAKILIWITSGLEDFNNPMHYLLMVVVGSVYNIFMTMFTEYTGNIAQHKLYTNITIDYCDKMLEADYQMYTEFSPGDLLTTHGSCWNIAKLLQTIIFAIKNIINFVVNLIAIFLVGGYVGIPITIAYAIAGIVIFKVNKKWEDYDSSTDTARRERNKEVDEIINGFNEVRSFAGSIDYHKKSIRKFNYDILDTIKKREKVSGALSEVIELIDGGVTISLMIYLIIQLQNGNISSPANAVSLIMYGWRLINPLASFVFNLGAISELKAPLPKFIQVMSYENKTSKGTINLNQFENEIKFDHVKFTYDDSNYVINDVSFSIKKGEHVGICGTSGGGKSTLLRLIPKFYDVTEGSISIDGIDIRDLTSESLRKHIGIVHQNTYIFDGTIADNIRYARRGRNASDNEVIDACKKASIYDFIMSLPDKFETNVGPRGLKLSGGQKQRISIARLFLCDPEIVILDEATSALDNETELVIQESLNAFKDKTMIVVAHRLTTIKDSDKIIVIDNHQIAEQGTHEELLSYNGVYSHMYR